MAARIGFLLGSGVSIPAGMPTTDEITGKVRQPDRYSYGSDGEFTPTIPSGPEYPLGSPKVLASIGHLLSTLSKVIQEYFSAEKIACRKVNYEDLYYAAAQIVDHLTQNYENPLLDDAVRSLLKAASLDHATLKQAADLACDYIHDVVARELDRKLPGEPTHLHCLTTALRDQRFSGVDIFTLNQDLLIEETLRRQRVEFVDGFRRGNDVDWWDRELLDRTAPHFLVKLHGSLDWFDFGDGPDRRLCRTRRPHARAAGSTDISIDLRYRDRCKLLIGTFNKIRTYATRPWFDLLYVFRRQLDRIEKVFVSGYSFRDKGVNTCLLDWLDGGRRRRLVCLDIRPDKVFESARGAIRNRWNDGKNRQLISHPHYLSDCNWEDLSSV